jgi:hypothetical protein
MLGISDLVQLRRFVSYTLVRILFWLIVAVSVVIGVAGIASSLAMMPFSQVLGWIFLVASLIGVIMGVILARIIAELVLVLFWMNERLGAIRNQRTLSAGERGVSPPAPKPLE